MVKRKFRPDARPAAAPAYPDTQRAATDRRAFLQRLGAAALVAVPVGSLLAACGADRKEYPSSDGGTAPDGPLPADGGPQDTGGNPDQPWPDLQSPTEGLPPPPDLELPVATDGLPGPPDLAVPPPKP